MNETTLGLLAYYAQNDCAVSWDVSTATQTTYGFRAMCGALTPYFVIDWGDGTRETKPYASNDYGTLFTHTYPESNRIYTVSLIAPLITRFKATANASGTTYSDAEGYAAMVARVREWGGLYDLSNGKGFGGCANCVRFPRRLPDRITTIGNYSFVDCQGLDLSVLPANLSALGARAFKNCSSLRITELPPALAASLTSIPKARARSNTAPR